MNFSELSTAFSLGLLATLSPCVLPLYPGFLAYLSGSHEQRLGSRQRYFLGFFVLAGVLSTMLLAGGLIALLGVSIGSALRWLIPLADGLILLLGVLLLFNVNPFKRLPQIQAPGLGHPFGSAFVYGLLYGPLTLPCSGAFVVSIFALSLSSAQTIGRLGSFLWFGLGFGAPLLFLSFLAGGAQRWITRFFARHAPWVNRAGGLILVAVGVYDLALNAPLLWLSWK
jgi:cytochrome c-type biogenesis protein